MLTISGVGFANSSEAPPPYTPQMTPWPPSPHGGQPAHASQHQVSVPLYVLLIGINKLC